MLEKDLNGIISKSLNELGGFGFKISDAGQYFTNGRIGRSDNIFDGIGYLNHHLFCWESKFLKEPKAFNFNNLEDHQIRNLINFYENVPSCNSLFLIGVHFKHGDTRVFYWGNEDLYSIRNRKENKENIFKKEFESLGNFVRIKKGILNLNEIPFCL